MNIMEATTNYRHVFFTRFNLPIELSGKTSTKVLEDDWLSQRIQLFGRYCYPGVARQSCSEFTWFVLFHPETPNWVFQSMMDFEKAHCIRAKDTSTETLVRIVEEHVQPSEWLLSTRLDNDDAIHRDFVANLRSSIVEDSMKFYNFPVGYTMHQSRVYRRTYSCNPFISLFEPRKDAKLVYCTSHEMAFRVAPVVNMSASAMWIQIIHGGNVANKMSGIRIARPELTDFQLQKNEDLTTESRVAFLADYCSSRLISAAKSAGSAVGLKWMLRQIAGKAK